MHSTLIQLRGFNTVVSDQDAALDEGARLLLQFRKNVDACLGHNVSLLEREPSSGLLYTMFRRALAHVEGCFVLFSHGYHASAEALCRTAIESSINLYYCSLGDTEEKILSYFKHYVAEEREQNRKWLASVNVGPHHEEAKQYHRESILNKERALRAYEAILEQAFRQLGQSYKEAAQTWPSVFERFREIGKEVDYRTIYAALCSQAHNDAEDLLNEFVARGSQIEGAMSRQYAENADFALYMVLMALASLIESTAIYLAKYSLGANEVLLPSLDEARRIVANVAQRRPQSSSVRRSP